MFSGTIIWPLALLIANALADDSAPKPLVIPPSQYFEGNDGPWSTFDVRVGTPEQYLRVLVSTASPWTMVPLADVACSTSVFASVPPDCAVSRGNLFNMNKSSTWHDLGIYGINQNGVGLEANLGYDQRAEFGLEHLGIGLLGPSFDNQTVAGIATPEPFYLGIFGLNNQPTNFSTLGNSSTPAFLTVLKDQKKIPSLSWSYTAGAKYRLKQVYGQLIFSGYDTSRFMGNSVSFTMADDITRDLVVALQSISYSGSTSMTLLSNPIDIFIDSTDPNLWLPPDACDAFEKAFGLTLDSTTGLYLVNDTHHNALLDANPQVSFRLSDVKAGGDTVSITLPYAAFDLTVEQPFVANTSRYFPLKRANSSTQYTLGRVFLQEAYLSADYERKVFNVSACVWNEGAKENIVTITSKDSPSDPGTSGGGGGSGNGNGGGGGSSPAGSSGSHLSGGAIAGIVVGSVLAALLVIAGLTYCILRKRRKWLSAGFSRAAVTPEPDETVLKGPVFNSRDQSSTVNNSTPMSAADMSIPARSTAEYSRSGAGDTPGAPGSTGLSSSVDGGSTVELDGRHIKPSTELDGREIRNPGGVYELPGTGVAGVGSREVHPPPERPESTIGELPSREESERGDHSPHSAYVSTIGSAGGMGREERPDSELVSPTTPARHSFPPRPF